MYSRLAASIAAVVLGGAVAFAGCSSSNKGTNHAPDTTSGMVGHVIVDAASLNTSAAVNVGGGSNAFSPPSVTIKPGSTVTWTLVSGTHNVTRP